MRQCDFLGTSKGIDRSEGRILCWDSQIVSDRFGALFEVTFGFSNDGLHASGRKVWRKPCPQLDQLPTDVIRHFHPPSSAPSRPAGMPLPSQTCPTRLVADRAPCAHSASGRKHASGPHPCWFASER